MGVQLRLASDEVAVYEVAVEVEVVVLQYRTNLASSGHISGHRLIFKPTWPVDSASLRCWAGHPPPLPPERPRMHRYFSKPKSHCRCLPSRPVPRLAFSSLERRQPWHLLGSLRSTELSLTMLTLSTLLTPKTVCRLGTSWWWKVSQLLLTDQQTYLSSEASA